MADSPRIAIKLISELINDVMKIALMGRRGLRAHGHGRLAHDCNLDSQISCFNRKLKAQRRSAPAR